ncbi:hypothetical protein KOW79_012411 [Hemibagrus wyckioides]|uniref:Interleukin-21 n=1 Tax=Hemibagrus wyckioides TaxID=337641 RepID=A0A9D3SHT1_9TELE|nr:hypothetical protein KOW79_012411 [Hemibagrus wyckioides]
MMTRGKLILYKAACWAQTTSPKVTKTEGLFQQAILHLKLLISKEKANEISLHSPTNDIKECCSQSALECFRKQLHSNSHKNQLKMKLARNLGKPSINAECKSCEAYPKVSSKEFLKNLQSLLQKCIRESLQCSLLELEVVESECFESRMIQFQHVNRAKENIQHLLHKMNETAEEKAHSQPCFCEVDKNKEQPNKKPYKEFIKNLKTLMQMLNSSWSFQRKIDKH